jgi:hypothetical protein
VSECDSVETDDLLGALRLDGAALLVVRLVKVRLVELRTGASFLDMAIQVVGVSKEACF